MEVWLFVLHVLFTPLFVIEGAITEPIRAWNNYFETVRNVRQLDAEIEKLREQQKEKKESDDNSEQESDSKPTV